MTTESQSELMDRLNLMEQMVKQGKRSTENYGWMFLLWGVGYLVAIGWSSSRGYPVLAWPVTMTVCVLLASTISAWQRRQSHAPVTPQNRSLGAIWSAVGGALFLYGFAAGIAGHAGDKGYLSTIMILLGVANTASSLTLRWWTQFAVATVWWTGAVAVLFVSAATSAWIFLAAIFLGQILFGIYLMVLEHRRNRRRKAEQPVAEEHHA